MTIEFTLPAELEAHDPPEARGTPRDSVRMLVSRATTGQLSHHRFGELPGLLRPGDLIVVNTSGTLPAAVAAGEGLTVHFSTAMPDGDWLIELRAARDQTTVPYGGGYRAAAAHWDGTSWPIDTVPLPRGADLSTLIGVSCTSSSAGRGAPEVSRGRSRLSGYPL